MLLDEFISFSEEQFKIMTGRPYSNKEKERAKDKFLQITSFPSGVYSSYCPLKKNDSHAMMAIKEMNMEFGESIVAILFKPNKRQMNQAGLEKIIQHIQQSFGNKRLPLAITLLPSQKVLQDRLLKMGFEITAYQMVGKVGKAYQVLSKSLKKNKKRFHVEPLMAKDFKEFRDLEILSHESDKTSRVNHFIKKFARSDNFKKHFFDVIVKNRSGFVIRDRDTIIASISYLIKPGIVQSGLISSVAVHPKYQGQGIAKVLYTRCLKEMKSKGIKFFGGNTTTSKVLSLSDKIGRLPNSIVVIKK